VEGGLILVRTRIEAFHPSSVPSSYLSALKQEHGSYAKFGRKTYIGGICLILP
jgi:hypothetical protein